MWTCTCSSPSRCRLSWVWGCWSAASFRNWSGTALRVSTAVFCHWTCSVGPAAPYLAKRSAPSASGTVCTSCPSLGSCQCSSFLSPIASPAPLQGACPPAQVYHSSLGLLCLRSCAFSPPLRFPGSGSSAASFPSPGCLPPVQVIKQLILVGKGIGIIIIIGNKE